MSVPVLVVLLLLAALWVGVPASRPIVGVCAAIVAAWLIIGYLQTHP